MYDLLTTLLSFAFALGVIIFVHELGHLLVAKAFDVRATAFSLGFGPKLWSFRRGETEYRLSAVPLGGYVKLGGEMPDEATGDPREFLSKPRWQRILVYLAGPAMNVVLAIALIAAVLMVGTVVPDMPDMPAEIGAVEEGSSAAAAGIRPGDLVTAVDGEPVEGWPEVAFALMTSPARPVELTVARGEERFEATVTPVEQPKAKIGDLAGLLPRMVPTITTVAGGSAAEKAGIESGDQVLAVDGRPVYDVGEFVDYVSAHPGEELLLELQRDGRALAVPVTPADLDGTGRIGVGLGFYQRYGPLEAVVQSVRYNVQIVQQTFGVLGKIFSGELSAKGALAGPIEIAAQTGQAARIGFRYLIYLMGFISISIAIVNLLPIPILDGGQIFILLVESTMRRDLSFRLKEVITQVGFVLIVLLMLTVIYFDISKNFLSGS
jgi:regulator of sigma E protease